MRRPAPFTRGDWIRIGVSMLIGFGLVSIVRWFGY